MSRPRSDRLDATQGTAFGRYTLFERLGETEVVASYRARVDGLEGFERRCAVDVIRDDRRDDHEAHAAFDTRARLASRLHHSNLVEVYDCGQIDGQPFVAREYVEGLSLEALLASWPEDTLPVALTLYVTGELCRALAYLRSLTSADGQPQPIAHGDIAPGNVLLGHQGLVKLTNFRTQGAGDVDGDLRALALLCHRMLLGCVPSDDERLTGAGLPGGLGEALLAVHRGAQDPDTLHEALLDHSFDVGVRVSDLALVEALRTDEEDLAAIEMPTTRPLGTPKPADGEPTYRVKTGAGSRLGAIPESNFESLLVSDAIAPAALVSVDGGAWEPLKGLSIYDAMQRLTPDNSAHGPATSLDPKSLAELGVQIGLERLTGCLRARSDQDLKQFWFSRGVPVHSSSTRDDELLGPCMHRAGLIDRDALETAQRVLQTQGGLFGEVLLTRGLCTAGALHRGLEMQLRQRFNELLAWPAGQLAFASDELPRGEVMRMSYDAVGLVATMVRSDCDEARLFGLLQPHLDAHFTLETDRHRTHDNLRLNGRELRTLGQLTEGLSLREHLERLPGRGPERETFLRVVFLLNVAGLLSFVTPGGGPPRRRRR